MSVMRIEVKKEGPVRYLSHLDYVEALQRALRRSGLPIAYSQGFNPHMKVSFAVALAVGVASEGEWADVELAELVSSQEFFERLAPSLPEGMKLLRVRLYPEKPKSLSTVLRAASYRASWELAPINEMGKLHQTLEDAWKEPEIMWESRSPKGVRRMDIRQELVKKPLLEENNGRTELKFWLKLSPTGSLKPTFLLEYLESKGFLSSKGANLIREGLWAPDEIGWKSPVED